MKQKKQVFLHVGTHKTGSSAIQHAMKEHMRQPLQAFGYLEKEK